MSAPTLQVEGMRKSYGGVRALRGVDLELHAGEVHALVGENGSGKSTLLRIIAGQLAPEAGVLRLEGRELRFDDASEAIASGIATVTQETTLVPDLSVTENIFLGHRKARARTGIDPSTPVRRLRPDEQQMVEIARAISIDARVLILDEPTSSLSDDEVEGLFEVVRALQRHGVAVAFVSHRIGEVFDIADR